MNPLWSPLVRELTPYVPGEQPRVANLIKLNTNENPYPPSPRAVAAMREEIGDDGASLRLYPDPTADRLKQAIVAHFAEYGVKPENVFVGGNGSDEALAVAFLALFKHDKPVLMPDVTYGFYPVYCRLYGIEAVTVPLDEYFVIRVDDYVRENGGIVIANPNAPTGHLLPLGDIERLAADNPDSAVLVDEAYIDFGGESAVALIGRLPNLLVMRTLSKSHALAGLRIGYALGDAALIEALDRVKNSFNSFPLDRIAIAGAAAALADREYLDETRRAVMKSRAALSQQLTRLGFDVLPSAANFLFVRHPRRDAREIAAQLRERGIIVRHFQRPRIDQHLRITVGAEAQCDALIAALDEILLPRLKE
ncbi:MAG: histidinol-phosphate transaminase [Candidatus Accumulibacter sp.]|jgi:histidinol-phosphate aminotransferase|nr:histidinol-phosphate transaminase [Accumulibacter sp.]